MKRTTVGGMMWPLLCAGILLAGCGTDPTGPARRIDSLPRALTTAERDLIRGSNAFGLELFRRVHATESGPNVFLSPLSASMALGMTANGAAGETWAGMRDALGFEGLTAEQINASYRELIAMLRSLDPAVDFRIGNSVWSRQGFPVLPSFYDIVRTYFDGEAKELDFDDPRSADVINNWVSTATNGRIEKAIDQISPADMMFLINAIYFNGDWRSQFDAGRTQRSPFRRDDGSTVTVDLMTQKLKLPVAFDNGWTAGELAYGGGAYGMILVVPRENVSLAEVVATFDDRAWTDLIASMDSMQMDVHLPKFRMEYDTYLNDPLVAMGMGQAFSPAADFSALTPADVCIQFVRQKTFVNVDEKGTEAAAVTVVGVGVTSLPPSLRADRSFLFAIRERLSGTILFMGAIGDPTATSAPTPVRPPPPC